MLRLFAFLRHLLRKKSGFYRREQLPGGSFADQTLPISEGSGTSERSGLPPCWDCCGDHQQAKNHCAAVCVCNALLYFRQGTAAQLFELVYSRMGNGPVLSLRKAGHWFRFDRIRRFDQLKEALADAHPCALLLSTPTREWHWVLVVGCREYPDGSRWLQIADGWNRQGERWYRLHGDSDWLSCRALSLK